MRHAALERVPGIAWVLLLALVVLSAGIGLRDPWPADEPRYALIARDMVASGEWFFPRVAGVLYPDKPPVFFWLVAACYVLTGSMRIAFLLPSLFAALATLWLVYDLGKRLWNRQTGVLAAGILLVTLQFALQARTAQIDATLAFWTTLGIYGLGRQLLLGDGWRWYVLGFAAIGAGVITKGVGFLPLLVFIPWAFARIRRWRTLPKLHGRLHWLVGPVIMLVVIGLWLVPMLVLVNAGNDAAYTAYRDNILFKQTGERYTDAWHHLKPSWYYLVEVIPLFWLPVTLALPWLVPAWKRDLEARDPRILLLLGWVLLVVLFFSLSPGKRGVYVLPAVPALALLAAPHARELLSRRLPQRVGFVTLSLFAAAWWLALLYFLVVAPEKGADLVERHQFEPWIVFAAFGATGLAWMLAGVDRGMYALAGYFLSLWLLFGFLAYPLMNPARSPAGLMRNVAQRIGPHAELGLVNWKEQLVLQAGRPVTHFGFRADPARETEDGLRWLLDAETRFLLLPDEAPHECLLDDSLQHVGFMHRTDWWLASQQSVAPACRQRLRRAVPTTAVMVDWPAALERWRQ